MAKMRPFPPDFDNTLGEITFPMAAQDVVTEVKNTYEVIHSLHQANKELVAALSLMCDTFLDTEGSHGQLERNSIDKAQAVLAKHREQA